jgi:hypothetical protein
MGEAMIALVGKRVRLRRDIEQEACGDHPTLVLAVLGETGVVEEVVPTLTYPVLVRMDRDGGGRPGAPYNRDRIGVTADEIEVLP